MSSLLSKSFDALKITTSQQNRDSTKYRPFKLIRPKRQPHLQFYGYGVSWEWLIQFAEQNCPEELPDRDDIGYKCMAAIRAYELIADLTTINTLDRKLCFNPKGGLVPPEWIAVYDGDYDDILSEEELLAIKIDTIHVLAVCSDEEDSFEERPVQGQMDYMTKLIGHGPQWWMGCRDSHC
ncbi:hypothetical protein DFJ58DRAFT_804732 [Suillus subalutaceus]|uniref:uncharacterized protein n=1 Tax=Suillus subalutaceus TaxID=48586 RepID=UPI001B87315E|nr:uncharacterized protein DFJ58DRAFT_804732 [Suillus subalutaceus]KAG1843274.1 hypothetical protein DFJ58DRAFT_804732 [Suillus subalutaceus]